MQLQAIFPLRPNLSVTVSYMFEEGWTIPTVAERVNSPRNMIFPGERRQQELILGLLSHSGIYATEYLTPPRHAISISWRKSETTSAA